MTSADDDDYGVLVDILHGGVVVTFTVHCSSPFDELFPTRFRPGTPTTGAVRTPLPTAVLVRCLLEVAVVSATNSDRGVGIDELGWHLAVVVPAMVLLGRSGDESGETVSAGCSGHAVVAFRLRTPPVCADGSRCCEIVATSTESRLLTVPPDVRSPALNPGTQALTERNDQRAELTDHGMRAGQAQPTIAGAVPAVISRPMVRRMRPRPTKETPIRCGGRQFGAPGP